MGAPSTVFPRDPSWAKSSWVLVCTWLALLEFPSPGLFSSISLLELHENPSQIHTGTQGCTSGSFQMEARLRQASAHGALPRPLRVRTCCPSCAGSRKAKGFSFGCKSGSSLLVHQRLGVAGPPWALEGDPSCTKGWPRGAEDGQLVSRGRHS